MNTPTPEEVRSRSALVEQRFPDTTDGDAALAAQLEVLAPIISDLTGRKIGPEGTPGVEVPGYLVPVAERAFALKLERTPTTAKERRRVLQSLSLRSFSAGPYSETYFGPDAAAAIKRLDPDEETHEVLWTLATEEKRQEWLFLWNGQLAPGVAVQSFAWSARRRLRQGY